MGTVGDDVSLESNGDIYGVNLISPTTTLEFGLTIIYGYNGSGKSGYTRILKRVCRARDGGSPIFPNVFEVDDGTPPAAKIRFTSGGLISDHTWTYGQLAPKELGRICIFDANCADFYVTKENFVTYRPFGLDLFDKLAATAEALRQRLEARKAALVPLCPAQLTIAC